MKTNEQLIGSLQDHIKASQYANKQYQKKYQKFSNRIIANSAANGRAIADSAEWVGNYKKALKRYKKK